MLSIKNLVKVYKTKGGAEVRALDGVSVDFPEKGMVFLLGRSGSGKSTLLNVAGGLDVPDSGEIIVKGKSSANFTGSDFDSYRNTYVGFIFQEYNILNEFNVEQNIALALQLQGKKNDQEAVSALLDKVDLDGLGKRKPNTLSGGQKQRVAIARALIKEPEIIMADEPTGALDSATGKQVLETLKKLSAEKLVIVVSHDRDFAEQYGDRIIELKDGKIISDISKSLTAPTNISENVNSIDEETVCVKDGSKLTEEEFKSIYEKIKEKGGEVIISTASSDMLAIKRACKITDDGKRETFVATAPDVDKRSYEGSPEFIKSRLPLAVR
ncbi:MAG: ABC transporter ATP-binding protein [Clostridia bacterium]|nr:ABC transporter ATP-binding protein [Clostridia bacterium]